MELIDQIIALLEAKFQGVRKDAIQNLASSIALQVEDEAGAKGIVDRMTAEKVNQFVTSYRSRIDKEVQQSNQAFEQNLRKKFDFTEKGTPQPLSVMQIGLKGILQFLKSSEATQKEL